MRRSHLLLRVFCCAALASQTTIAAETLRSQSGTRYRIQARSDRAESLRERFNEPQLALLEKLNRADIEHLGRLPVVVVPESWSEDELSYSALPIRYGASDRWSRFLVVHLPGQLFGAYEFGSLVRWGPISSGGRNSRTSAGMFALNWRSTGRASTVDPDWFMRWYFNFGNREGLAFHAYPLPGYPASHGCIRLLDRDAQWLFEWGQPWTLDLSRTRVMKPGTPVLIAGEYDFEAAPPWRSLTWLSQLVELPSLPMTDADTSLMRP
jgi:hypothetical protein